MYAFVILKCSAYFTFLLTHIIVIYKSFNQPSEAEEGIEFVRSSLQNQTNNKDLLIMSIGHFLSIHLPPSWIDSMCKFMLDRMQLILLKFFTFKHYCSCYFNCNISNSRLFVLQCALHRRFPLLISEGCASLSRSPVFYFNRSLFNENNIECSSWRLLQNRLSFKSVPLHRSTHHQTPRMAKKQKKDDVVNDNIVTPLSMDLRTLEQEIERDQSKGRLPCVVIASPTDNLQKIRSICDRHGLWLHIEGGSNSLLLAAATTLPKSTRIMMQCADSITCKPFEWFKDASDSDKMLAKTLSETNPKIINKGSPNNINFKVMRGTKSYFGNDVAGCSSTLTFIREDLRDSPPPKIQYSDSDFVMMFPLWHCLVTRSIKQIKNRVDHCLNLCKYLNQQLNERKNIFGTQSMRMPASLIFQIVPNMSVIDLQQFKLDINS